MGGVYLNLGCPVLAVMGSKSSGKTTVIELLAPEMIRSGFSVAAVKHIAHKDFSIDTPGSDTWRLSNAGARPIIAFSDGEVSIIVKAPTLSLDRLAEITLNLGANVLILEGFSSIALKERSIGKIICVRSMEEYIQFNEKVGNEVIAFCSLYNLNEPVLNIREDSEVIVKRALNFVKKKTAILEISKSLAGLNCGKCGNKSCEEMAEAIYEGRAKPEGCIVLKKMLALNAKIKIDGYEVPLQPFVSEFIRKTVLSMISSLKNVSIKGDERIYIEVSKSKVFNISHRET